MGHYSLLMLVDLEAGHTYDLKSDGAFFGPYHIWLEDAETGEVLFGRIDMPKAVQ